MVRRGAGVPRKAGGVVGVNDTTLDGRGTRVARSRSGEPAHPAGRGRGGGLLALVVGPPPAADGPQNRRIAALDERLAATTADARAPYVPVFAALRREDRWMDEVAAGDGLHSAAAGYGLLADLVAPVWLQWLLSD